MNAEEPEITNRYVQKEITRGKQYFLVLLKRGSNTSLDSATVAKNQENHLIYLFTLKREGKLPLFGPLLDSDDLRGICLFNVPTKAEVAKLLDADPHVKSGRLTYEIYQWFGLPGDTLP